LSRHDDFLLDGDSARPRYSSVGSIGRGKAERQGSVAGPAVLTSNLGTP
jgi:hypothetical protein